MYSNFFVPGPTWVRPEILAEMTRPMIGHRSVEFREMYGRILADLKQLFVTAHDTFVVTASGTAVMEASLANCANRRVLVTSCGAFSERWANIAESLGLEVDRLDTAWGSATDPGELADHLASRRTHYDAVTLTHNETSTGVTNDLQALAAAIRAQRPDILLVVDAVSSLSCVDLQMDAWDLDVVFTGAQKGWMVPPGLAMIGVSERAWVATEKATLPRFYWDFRTARKSLEKGQTPYTPPVSLYFGLDVALGMMRAEGREAIFARHQRVADLTRSRAQAMGLELFADPAHASNTVTAIKVPSSVEGKALTKALREHEGVVIAGGQEWLEGQIIRIGHLGYVHEPEIAACMDALERQLAALGYHAPATSRAEV